MNAFFIFILQKKKIFICEEIFILKHKFSPFYSIYLYRDMYVYKSLRACYY